MGGGQIRAGIAGRLTRFAAINLCWAEPLHRCEGTGAWLRQAVAALGASDFSRKPPARFCSSQAIAVQ
jgi:hypothetical protein